MKSKKSILYINDNELALEKNGIAFLKYINPKNISYSSKKWQNGFHWVMHASYLKETLDPIKMSLRWASIIQGTRERNYKGKTYEQAKATGYNKPTWDWETFHNLRD